MICRNCGRNVPDNFRFCDGCGAPMGTSDAGSRTNAQQVNSQQAGGYRQANPQQTAGDYRQVNSQQGSGYRQAGDYQQTNTRQGYGQQSYGRQAQGQQAYGQQAYGTAAPAPKPAVSKRAKVTTRWPAVTGVMGILYFLFYILTVVFWITYYADMGIPAQAYLVSNLIYIILASAVPVLFLVHTKKLAFLTAIPMVLLFILGTINMFGNLSMIGDGGAFFNLYNLWLPQAISTLLVIFYVIQMFVRPANAALSVLYLIISIILLLYSGGAVLTKLVQASYLTEIYLLSDVFTFIASIFSTVAYCIAMFSSRKR